VSSDPVILYCSGIPIAPSSLDFGTGATQAQLDALSSFSQMVNAIPSGGEVWLPGSGSETWTIYDNVLSKSEFAVEAVASPQTNQAMSYATVSSLHESAAPSLKGAGFRFAENKRVLSAQAAPPSPATDTAAAPPASLAATFSQLSVSFSLAARMDTLGNTFYPTYVYPPDFDQAVNDAFWIPFTITPGQTDPWMAVGEGNTISGEMISLPLQRAWWNPWVFSSRAWRFVPVYGFGLLSDGGSPPSGQLPMWATALMIARNLKVVSDSTTPGAAPALKLKGSAEATPEAGGMSIIGFYCTPLPLCPNPDPALAW
jgi:hypothetical protein